MSWLSGARHPAGLYPLCIVELCERFAGSLLGSVLLLYLTERLGLGTGVATRLGGAFNGLVYLSSVVGGVVADRWLGTRRAILIGAGLLAAGYAVLSLDTAPALAPAAALLIGGQALFKPTINAAVGTLYDRADRRREEAYARFYVIFNVGAALGPLAGGALRSAYGWSIAFAAAAAAMLLALAVGLVSYRWLAATEHRCDLTRPIATGAGPSADSGWALPAMAGLLGAVLLFTAAYEQSGQSLLLWARDCTERSLVGHTLPPSYLLALPGGLVLALQPLLSRLLAAQARRGREPSPLMRLQAGLLCTVAAYLLMVGAALRLGPRQVPVSAWWLVGCLVALTFAELLVYPVSLALLTRLTPQNRTAAATGIWLAAVAVGQWLAGEVAAHWTSGSHASFFAAVAALGLLAAGVLALATGRIRRALLGDCAVPRGGA